MTPEERAEAFVLANAGSRMMHHMVPVVRALIEEAVAEEKEKWHAAAEARFHANAMSVGSWEWDAIEEAKAKERERILAIVRLTVLGEWEDADAAGVFDRRIREGI